MGYARTCRGGLATGIGIVLVAGLVSAVPAAGASEGEPEPPVPRLTWKPCGEKLKAFECATAKVPTDYDDPDGATTEIALTRLPATDPDRRVGSLFTNPGGPGGSGVDFVQSSAKQAFSPKVRTRFDIIGFDPRGVASSDPVTCYANPKEESEAFAGLAAFPATAKQERRYIAKFNGIARDCASRSGDRVAHSSTANVARDMDVLREAVGDDELSYVGYSYGTYLGATYARLFPDRVRALVLDGTIDPASYSGSNGDRRSVGARIGQGGGTSDTYGEFLRLCREAGPKRCALAKLGNPRVVMERTLRRLRKNPVEIELPDGTPFTATYSSAVQLIFTGMYDTSGWAGLGATLAHIATGGDSGKRGTGARRAAKYVQKFERRGKDYPSVGGSLSSMCVDSDHPLGAKHYPALADGEDASAPHFGRFRAWVGVHCRALGVDDSDRYTGPWKQEVDEPVMVVGTRFDPGTPYAATRPYTDRFPDGRMLTVDGWGHTAIGKSRCVDRRIATYLIDGDAEDGAVCQQDTAPFAPQASQRSGSPVPSPLL